MAALGLAFAVAAPAGQDAHASDGAGEAEARLYQSANHERRLNGLPLLTLSADLVPVARHHSAVMAQSRQVRHNERLAEQVGGWARLAENVGMGPSAETIHAALMASPGHRRNILDPAFSEVGVGVVDSGDGVWVTQVFRQPSATPRGGVAAASAPPPVLTPVPAEPQPHFGAAATAPDQAVNGAPAGPSEPFGPAPPAGQLTVPSPVSPVLGEVGAVLPVPAPVLPASAPAPAGRHLAPGPGHGALAVAAAALMALVLATAAHGLYRRWRWRRLFS